ncbi:hypothetical protein DXG01_001730 [Tephrocybe rancida]|nr:hypothetical protein DXG01_001730 [Tephrocybe rancida]
MTAKEDCAARKITPQVELDGLFSLLNGHKELDETLEDIAKKGASTSAVPIDPTLVTDSTAKTMSKAKPKAGGKYKVKKDEQGQHSGAGGAHSIAPTASTPTQLTNAPLPSAGAPTKSSNAPLASACAAEPVIHTSSVNSTALMQPVNTQTVQLLPPHSQSQSIPAHTSPSSRTAQSASAPPESASSTTCMGPHLAPLQLNPSFPDASSTNSIAPMQPVNTLAVQLLPPGHFSAPIELNNNISTTALLAMRPPRVGDSDLDEIPNENTLQGGLTYLNSKEWGIMWEDLMQVYIKFEKSHGFLASDM